MKTTTRTNRSKHKLAIIKKKRKETYNLLIKDKASRSKQATETLSAYKKRVKESHGRIEKQRAERTARLKAFLAKRNAK